MLTLPAPTNLNGTALTDELRAAGVPVELVTFDPDGRTVTISGADDSHRAAAESVVTAHKPPPVPPDPDVEFRKALEAATTVAQIKDALLGKTGPGAEPRRPDSR